VTPGAGHDPTAVFLGLDPTHVTDATTIEAFAPGRVNLIGEHTDYTGGLALPMAVDMGTTVRGTRTGSAVRLASAGIPGLVEIANAAAGVTDPAATDPPWGTYVAAVVDELSRRGQVNGFDGIIGSTLPIGAGLSSSASLELAVALALGFHGTAADLATLGQAAEQRASGVPCGLMDQLASACGIPGHALLIDFSTLEVAAVPMPGDIEVVVVHSGQSRTLAGSAYAQRRAECEAAAERVGPLRHARLSAVEALDDPVLRKRARHVVTENQRVLDMVDALHAGDPVTAGQLLTASHRSLARDFEVSTDVLDTLVSRLESTDGVFGARLTGGGFGGCVVALTAPGSLAAADNVWPVRPAGGATVTVPPTGH
jgi:galactokinase